MNKLHNIDSQMADLLIREIRRQQETITLIASENYAPRVVFEAQEGALSNKYAEGYPNRRYYSGCEIIDLIEQLAIDRCKSLFKANHANVQPHAGSQANMAVYLALLKPGETLMGMSLSAGGHLTHGHNVNFSGNIYNTVQYGLDSETECLNYSQIEQLAHQYKPKVIIAGASAYSRLIDFNKFSQIAKDIGAYLVADIAHIAGLIATGLHPSPVDVADVITSTTHKTLRGPRGAFILSQNQQLCDKIDKSIIPGSQGGPMMHTIAAKAVAFKLASELDFLEYQKQVLKNSSVLSETLKHLGYRIVSQITENHMFIVDLQSKGINGYEAERLLNEVGICVTRSCIPFDKQKPWLGSGIRLGTPAVTTRGMKEVSMQLLAELINEVLTYSDNLEVIKIVKEKVKELCKEYPLEDNPIALKY